MDPTSSSNAGLALISSSSGPIFAQQGSVDWVALSNSTFSASVALLARFSRAGLEPLTVAVAQGVFSKVPIGVHGEKFLEKAMSGLKAHNISGTALWFGFGVRHILHELPKSSQGASAVAIAAALSEGFSKEFTATVLYDLVRISDVPAHLTPAYAQWLAYAQICAGVLSCSGIGERFTQLAKMLGINIFLTECDYDRMDLTASAPEQVAKFLLGIGSIQRRETEAISVVGGVTCLWGYVICDMIFGFPVQLCGRLKLSTETTTTLGKAAQNYDSNSHNYQIRFVVESSESTTAAMVQTAGTYLLHPGRAPFHLQPLGSSKPMYATGRVPFDNLLHVMLAHELPDDPETKENLAIMLGCHVLIHRYSRMLRHCCEQPSPVDLLDRFANIVSDLKPFCGSAELIMTSKMREQQGMRPWRESST